MTKNFPKLIEESESIAELKEIAHMMLDSAEYYGLLATFARMYHKKVTELIDALHD